MIDEKINFLLSDLVIHSDNPMIVTLYTVV